MVIVEEVVVVAGRARTVFCTEGLCVRTPFGTDGAAAVAAEAAFEAAAAAAEERVACLGL